MTIKAIFFDIDGTLVPFQSAKWLPSTKLALERLREKGILTFVATGRSKYEIRNEHLLDGLQFDGYLTNNGQDAYDASWSQIYGKPLDPNDVEALLNWSDRRNSTCWLANAETTCINRDSEEYRTAMGAIHTNLLPVGDLHEMNKGPVFKLVLFAPPEEMDEPIRLAPHSRTTQWFSLGHDFVTLDGGKDNAVRALLARYGIAPEEAMAFGDSENDASMLRAVGLGVAMGNATPEAREAAYYVTDDAENDGIYHALKHFDII